MSSVSLKQYVNILGRRLEVVGGKYEGSDNRRGYVLYDESGVMLFRCSPCGKMFDSKEFYEPGNSLGEFIYEFDADDKAFVWVLLLNNGETHKTGTIHIRFAFLNMCERLLTESQRLQEAQVMLTAGITRLKYEDYAKNLHP